MSSTNFTQYHTAIPVSSQPAFRIFDSNQNEPHTIFDSFKVILQIGAIALSVRAVMLILGMSYIGIPLIDHYLSLAIHFILSLLSLVG